MDPTSSPRSGTFSSETGKDGLPALQVHSLSFPSLLLLCFYSDDHDGHLGGHGVCTCLVALPFQSKHCTFLSFGVVLHPPLIIHSMITRFTRLGLGQRRVPPTGTKLTIPLKSEGLAVFISFYITPLSVSIRLPPHRKALDVTRGTGSGDGKLLLHKGSSLPMGLVRVL